MSKFLSYLFRGMGEFVTNAAIDVVYAIVCAVEVVFCLWIGYSWFFAPMAAAPGSRDSAALLLVGPVILGLSLVPATIMARMTRNLFQAFFPNWRPVIID